MASVAKQYRLSEGDSLKIFHEQIAPTEFKRLEGHGHIHDDERPIAAFVVGQTGAGKTRIAPELTAALQQLGRKHAHFIADTYKTYHPRYLHIMQEKPDLASPATGADARRWLEMACEHAVLKRYDALVESACRHPEDFSSLARIFHDGGYRVCVAVLAVPEPLSLLGLLVRYYRRLPEAQSGNLPLRLTPLRVHDDSYAGLLEAADFVDRSDAVDHVAVVRRNNLVAHANSRARAGGGGDDDDDWAAEAGAKAALDLERVRPLLDGELSVALSDLASVDQFRDDAGVADRIAEVEQLMAAIQTKGSDMGPFPALHRLDSVAFLKGSFVLGAADHDKATGTSREAEPGSKLELDEEDARDNPT